MWPLLTLRSVPEGEHALQSWRLEPFVTWEGRAGTFLESGARVTSGLC